MKTETTVKKWAYDKDKSVSYSKIFESQQFKKNYLLNVTPIMHKDSMRNGSRNTQRQLA